MNTSDDLETRRARIREEHRGVPGTISTEREILIESLDELPTTVPRYEDEGTRISNPLKENEIGWYRPFGRRMHATMDAALVKDLHDAGLRPPSFEEAGPRRWLHYDPVDINVGILTAGGIAPGLNTVIHSIVKRHEMYRDARKRELQAHGDVPPTEGRTWGFRGGFQAMCTQLDPDRNMTELRSQETAEWTAHGGTELGALREPGDLSQHTDRIMNCLQALGIRILYVIGGNGSLLGAYFIAQEVKKRGLQISVVGIPKTMDNDIVWVWQSFGFDTAVEEATKVVNAGYTDARSTHRIGLVQLFGRQSGFVVAHAVLASGRPDVALIPEITFRVGPLVDFVRARYENARSALVVAAEWAGADLIQEQIAAFAAERGLDPSDTSDPVLADARRGGAVRLLREILSEAFGDRSVFVVEPRYIVRAVPPNSVDQIYCQRLGLLAVDNALAGYSSFMISQWLTEYVLVPLVMLVRKDEKSGHWRPRVKTVPPRGIFWTSVVNATGQPDFGTD